MAKTLYALLVGIDEYPAPIRPLTGCVNDVTRIEELLRLRVGAGGFMFPPPLVLKNKEATREAIIDGFRTHLRQAGKDDVALFYYSGHGSQEQAPPEFWHLEPDKLNETLVCYNSRVEGNYDLADKELAHLIAEVSEHGPHTVVILDSCHSGSGTRNADVTGVRRVPSDERVRPLNTYLFGANEAEALKSTRNGESSTSDWFALPDARYILLSACRADEEAKECALAGETRGVFSYFLEQGLQRSGASLTYRDLFKQVNALVRNRAALQSPQLESPVSAMLEEPFLGGAIAAHDPYFTLSYNEQDRQWEIDGGRVHGMPDAMGAETTTLRIYPNESTLEQMRDPNAALGNAQLTKVFPGRSQVKLGGEAGRLDTERAYRAVIVGLPLPPLGVQLAGDDAALKFVRDELAQRIPKLVAEVPAGPYELRAVNGVYRIMRPADGRRLVADIPGGRTPNAARQAVQQLEHIARWTQVLELANPQSSIANAIKLELHGIRGQFGVADAQAQPIVTPTEAVLRLSYYFADTKWQQPSFKLKLINTSDRPLHYALLDLTQTFGIDPGLQPAGSVELKPGEETWAANGQPIYVTVPKRLWERGYTELRDVLKLIVCTAEFDGRLLQQGDLEAPDVRGTTKGTHAVTGKSALNRLLDRVQLRGLSTISEDDAEQGDWATREMTFSTFRPQESIALPAAGKEGTLGYGVELQGHAQLQGRARLTTMPQASREVGVLTLPALLRDDPLAQPFEFSSGRGGEPGLSVLELFDLQDHTAVQPGQPLRVQIESRLGDDEHLLPVGFDGEFWLPLGHTTRQNGRTEVIIERLPQPQNTRSLTGSLRIMFQKIIRRSLGVQFPYPLLSMAEVAADGEVTYRTADPQEVGQRVAGANRILLYIHGIIGETKGMASSARGLKAQVEPALCVFADHYDLILTFDYENINTPIDDTARGLKQRLAAVGLDVGHGKILHVVAHSMGGLVARWLIEHQGGNAVIQHLVMLGTPNAGSPWPKLQDWATTALGIGLNTLGAGAWPAMVLGGLVRAIEKVDVALDQMAPGSPILKTLADSPDPGTPYTIIAGDTHEVWKRQAASDPGRLGRLLERLAPRRLLHNVTAPAFFGEPNDIAVSVNSMTHLPAGWAGKREPRIVACDHITYFSTEAGLRALAEALE